MVIGEIFKVIYAPREAFKEIAQNPKYLGPLLVMILFIAINLGSAYILAAKTYVEATVPPLSLEQKDLWTESTTFWQPVDNAKCSENFVDHISGKYYGNLSIEFSADQNSQIAMELRNITGVYCSLKGGYTRLYLRVKWTSPSSSPNNVSLHLYSDSAIFFHDITDYFSNAAFDVWNNLTISLPESLLENINCRNITGLKLGFMWSQKSNIRVLIDGLFFGGPYKPLVEDKAIYLANQAVYSFMQFFLRWFLFGGVIHVFMRIFRAKTVWRVTLILSGFALITMLVQAVIGAAVFSALPTIKYSFELMGGVEGESQEAYNRILEESSLVFQIYNILQIVMIMWTIVLCAIAIRLTAELPWTSSFLIAFTAYFAALFIESFLM
ncbi:hypothetical protein KEJ24_03920 [Candidatus Bathyarchaeota archaeon]|nr:hypothetical protein [Candidatus Bathyarchaeota archaeon]